MGRSLALEAARRGGNVVITGRRPAPLLETKADMDDLIRHLGLTNQTLFVQGDVSDPKYVGEMFEQIEKEFGRIDVLYNNAGVSGPVVFGSAYEEGNFDEYREAVNVHLTGSWMASLEAARIMEGSRAAGRSSWWEPSTARASTTTSCTPTPGVSRTLRAVRQTRPRRLPCVALAGKNHRPLPQSVGGLHGADPAGKRRLRQGVEGACPHRAQRSSGSAGA